MVGLNPGSASRRTAGGPRTLPIRLAPVPGEALESWLAALAHRLDTPWGSLLTALAPAAAGRAGLRRSNLTAHLDSEEASAIAAATGIWQPTIQALTLRRYDGRLITIDRSIPRVLSPWNPTRSRNCPHCLRTSGGRWQLDWRLPWVFACDEHTCTLADTVPNL